MNLSRTRRYLVRKRYGVQPRWLQSQSHPCRAIKLVSTQVSTVDTTVDTTVDAASFFLIMGSSTGPSPEDTQNLSKSGTVIISVSLPRSMNRFSKVIQSVCASRVLRLRADKRHLPGVLCAINRLFNPLVVFRVH
jgi:hypothetical protein